MNQPSPPAQVTPIPSTRTAVRQGFVAMLPLWAGAIPAGVGYGVAARGLGLGGVETQLMSMVVFSAAGQMGVLSTLAGGGSALAALGSILALNAQLPLIGIAVGRATRPTWPQRLLVAGLLTDGAFGVAAARPGPLRLATLVGAGAGMWVGWNLGTALGIAVGAALPDPRRWGLDLVIPLTFAAVVAPLARRRPGLLAALVGGATAALLIQVAPVGPTVLGAGIAGALAGTWGGREEARP